MPAAGFGLLLVLVVVGWRSGADLFRAPVHSYHQSEGRLSTRDQPERTTFAGPDSARAPTGLHIEAMMRRALTDVDTARLLAAYIQLCSSALGAGASEFPAQRFADPLWKPWLGRCTKEQLSRLIENMGAWATPDGAGWNALEVALQNDGEGQAGDRRDSIAIDLMSNSDDPELVAQAAALYFRGKQGTGRPIRFEHIEVDLALLLACRIGRDCSSASLEVAAECAATPDCYPGRSMEQVIALRRSPQEMEFLAKQVQAVMSLRGGSD